MKETVAMSQDKIEMVERFFEARSQGDLSYLEFIDPDAVFDLSESRATHQGVYPQGANVFTFKDGKIVRFQLFQTKAEALAAVTAD
jgi:hypothetical protein